jgi:hypothetical protein
MVQCSINHTNIAHPARRTIRASFIDSALLSIDIGWRIYRLQAVQALRDLGPAHLPSQKETPRLFTPFKGCPDIADSLDNCPELVNELENQLYFFALLAPFQRA